MEQSLQINRTAEEVFATSTPYNAARYQRLAGRVMGELFINILSRLYQAYPDLEPQQIRPSEDPGPAITREVAESIIATMIGLRSLLSQIESEHSDAAANSEDAWLADAAQAVRGAVYALEAHVYGIHPSLRGAGIDPSVT